MTQCIFNYKQVTCQQTDECSICLDEMKNFVCPWVCMHKFHEKCIQTLLICPLCRNTQLNAQNQMELSKKQKFAYMFRLWYYRNLCRTKIMPTYYIKKWENKSCIINTHQIEFKISSIPPHGIVGFCTECKKMQYFNKSANCNIRQYQTVRLVW